jgi:hypothetical protein
MLNKITCFLIVFTALCLAACKQVIPPTPTNLPTSLPNTNTPRPALTLTLTPTSAQTQIDPKRATAAAALTQIANRTAESLSATINAPTPDWQATYQALPAVVMAATKPSIIETHSSPDGQFRAEVVRYDCVLVGGVDENAYEQLKIIRISDGSETIVADQLQNCGGIGAYGLGGLFWSPDGRYFYFTSSREGVPDGDFCELWVRSMSRVDVTTGVIEVTPGLGEFLADGRTMVIPGRGGFILWDLDEGKKMRLPFMFPGAVLADYQLSPDKTSLVYLQRDNCAWMPGKTDLVLWDTATALQTLLLEADDPPLTGFEWEIPSELTLWYADSTQQKFNLVTGEFTP